MEILKEILDSEGDKIKVFKRVDSTDGIERLCFEIEINVTKDWLKQYTGVYKLAKTKTVKSNEIVFLDPMKNYGSKTLNKDEIKKHLDLFNNNESIIIQADKADILRHLLLRIP